LDTLAASADVFALDWAIANLLNVDPTQVPTLAAAMNLGLNPTLDTLQFPHLHPADINVLDWKLPDRLMPIDFGMPRLIRSTFKHFYIRWIKEPMNVYAHR
jgi:uncharacterized protein (DUF362 family)